MEAAGPGWRPDPGVRVDVWHRAGDLAGALGPADAVVCLLTDRVDRAALAAAPALRVVANVAVGVDNIDLDAAAERGVVVTNTPDVLTDATADLTMALLLAVARRVPEGDAHVRSGRWDAWHLLPAQLGLDVSGRTLGIVGLGRIGQAVARRAAHGFGMRVLYHSRTRRPDAEAVLGVVHTGLDELLSISDIVSLHAPLTPATRHLIGARELARMSPHAILVNTARGPLVDEAALADALAQGRLAGAGLDVFEREPAVHPGLLARRERVVLLPHVGSATASTRRRMARTALDNAQAVLRGDPPPNPVPAR
jgi:glyoxylate reductase